MSRRPTRTRSHQGGAPSSGGPVAPGSPCSSWLAPWGSGRPPWRGIQVAQGGGAEQPDGGSQPAEGHPSLVDVFGVFSFARGDARKVREQLSPAFMHDQPGGCQGIILGVNVDPPGLCCARLPAGCGEPMAAFCFSGGIDPARVSTNDLTRNVGDGER